MNALPMTEMRYKNSEQETLDRMRELRSALGDRLLILGHHYQREEVYAFADITGDSLKLAQHAAQADAPYIIFCGVHFMAETADILTSDQQAVILPDPAAGCSMADMADLLQVAQCWQEISEIIDPDEQITPVTYINSTAALKSFCGQHGGTVCTSSNARRALEWSWQRRGKVLFFPDQHLGRNTALAMGMKDEEMLVWNPGLPMGGNSPESIEKSRLLLWDGCCSVHQLFQAEHVTSMRRQHPGIEILAHPECMREVCDIADMVGSTEAIIRHVDSAPEGQQFAIGTELNLVNRLRLNSPEKPVYFLSPTLCMCSTMFRTDPQHLCASLEALTDGRVENRITVTGKDKKYARIALKRMLQLA